MNYIIEMKSILTENGEPKYIQNAYPCKSFYNKSTAEKECADLNELRDTTMWNPHVVRELQEGEKA